jgi:hypothetical protein
VTDAGFLVEYLRTLDGDALAILPMLAPGFTFSILWTDETGAREFAGGLEEFHGYLAQRDADGQLHHVVTSSRSGGLEVALGYTTRYGEPLATFTMAAQLAADGRAERLFAARTTSLSLGPEPA